MLELTPEIGLEKIRLFGKTKPKMTDEQAYENFFKIGISNHEIDYLVKTIDKR